MRKSSCNAVTICASLRLIAFSSRESCAKLDEVRGVHCLFVGLQYWCWSVQAKALTYRSDV